MVGSGLPQARPGAGRSRLGSLKDGPRRGAAGLRKDSELRQVSNISGRGQLMVGGVCWAVGNSPWSR